MTVVFEPQPPRRANGPRPAFVAAVVIVVVGAALLKPWNLVTPTEKPGVSRSPAAAPSTVRPTPGVDRRLPRPNAVARALGDHDEWGVGVLLESAAGDGLLEELWEPATPAIVGSIPSVTRGSDAAVVFRPGGRTVRLLALTLPPDLPAVHHRIIIVGRPLGRVESVPVRDVSDQGGGAAVRLFAPTETAGWEPGVYQLRFDIGDVPSAVTVALFDADPVDPPSD